MAKKPLRSSASRPSKAAKDDTLGLTTLPPAQTVVRLPENSSGVRSLDFGRYYGTGCDVVVYACQRTLERMAEGSAKSDGKTLSPTTIERAAQSSTSISFTLVVSFAKTFDTGPRIILTKS